MNIKINPLLANRNAGSFISITLYLSLCDVLSKACDKGTVETGLLIRKAKAWRGGEGGGWQHYINSFMLHQNSSSDQTLILSDLYLERAYIMMGNQVNLLQRTSTKTIVYVTPQQLICQHASK